MQTTETTRTKQKNIKKLAKNVATEVVNNIMEQEHEIPLDETPEDFGLQEMGEEDVFVEAAGELIKAGDFPVYTIYKNGALLTSKSHPYSWMSLQKDHGPGSYKVVLRSKRSGRITKTQSNEIGDPTTQAADKVEFAFGSPNNPMVEAAKQPNFMELFMLKSDLDEKNRIRQAEMESKLETKQREIETRLAEAERSKEAASNDMFKMMMTMQQESSKQLQTVMMESTKSQMSLMMTLMTKMSEKKEDNGLKAFELAKMLGDAEKNGYSRWKDIAEMIDKKAEAKAEELASQHGDGDESLMKTVVKGFIPLISQAVSSGALSGAPQGPQPTPQQIEMQRREQEHRRVQIENQKLAQRRDAEIKKARAAQAAVVKSAAVKPAAPVNPQEVNDLPSPALPTKKAPRDTMNGKFKDHIQSLVLPILAEDYTNGIPGATSADKCLAHLAMQDISRKDVLDNFKLQDIISLVDVYGLPPETVPWFKDFYAALEAPKGAVISGGLPNANVETTTRNAIREPSQNS